MAKHAHTTPAAAPTNVVPLHATESTEDIVQSVEQRRLQQQARIRDALEDCIAILTQRKLDTMRGLLPIGQSMDYQTLLDWMEIGRRMAKGRPA